MKKKFHDLATFHLLPTDNILNRFRIPVYGKELTHYQVTNFRLFQTERVCRPQFQTGRKWQKVIQTGRKHCGKTRNCSLRAISPFLTVFSKGLFPMGIRRRQCVGMGLTITLYTQSELLTTLK